MEEWPRLTPELYVSDLEKTVSFYTDILGFEIKFDRPDEGFAYLDKEGSHMMFERMERHNGRKWITGDLEHPLGRGINFQIEIDDVDTLYNKLNELEYPIFMPIEEKWYKTGDVMGGNRQFIVQDPDGYLLRFFTHLGDKPIED